MMIILPWAGSTPLFKTVNPQQAHAMRSHRFMARPWVSPLCFPHEDNEEEMENESSMFSVSHRWDYLCEEWCEV